MRAWTAPAWLWGKTFPGGNYPDFGPTGVCAAGVCTKHCANPVAGPLDWRANLLVQDRLWTIFARHIAQPGPDRLGIELSFLHQIGSHVL